MPTSARSGSTNRTGWSISAARRSRHAASACATPAAGGRERPGLLDRAATPRRGRGHPVAVGAAARTRSSASRAVARASSRSASVSCSSSRSATSEAAYGCCSSPQRSPQPVGEPVGLGQPLPSSRSHQASQRRQRCADEAGGQLGVEQPARHGAARQVEDLEILAGGVHHGQARPLEHLGAAAPWPPPAGRPPRSGRPRPAAPAPAAGSTVRSRWNSVSSA